MTNLPKKVFTIDQNILDLLHKITEMTRHNDMSCVVMTNVGDKLASLEKKDGIMGNFSICDKECAYGQGYDEVVIGHIISSNLYHCCYVIDSEKDDVVLVEYVHEKVELPIVFFTFRHIVGSDSILLAPYLSTKEIRVGHSNIDTLKEYINVVEKLMPSIEKREKEIKNVKNL